MTYHASKLIDEDYILKFILESIGQAAFAQLWAGFSCFFFVKKKNKVITKIKRTMGMQTLLLDSVIIGMHELIMHTSNRVI